MLINSITTKLLIVGEGKLVLRCLSYKQSLQTSKSDRYINHEVKYNNISHLLIAYSYDPKVCMKS